MVVTVLAIDQCLVEMVYKVNKGVGDLRHALANDKKFTHASCFYKDAYLFRVSP